MNKVAVVSSFEKLCEIDVNSYQGFVVNNGIYAFFGNSPDKIEKKALKSKVMSCLQKMNQQGWEIIYG